jgi:RHS repeat-associated protein
LKIQYVVGLQTKPLGCNPVVAGAGSDLVFKYDPQGNRIYKLEKTKNASGVLLPSTDWVTTYYSRDASGNIMATYTQKKTTSTSVVDLYLTEQDIYGSSRVGVYSAGLNLTSPVAVAPSTQFKRVIGNKQYEYGNHLGNVLVVSSDKKIPVDNLGTGLGTTIAYFKTEVVSATDYGSFGLELNGRTANSPASINGFNGKRKDNEINGEGNSYDFGARIYDSRLGRWLSIDVEFQKSPGWTPYRFAFDNPLKYIDQEGNFEIDPTFAKAYPKVTLLLQNMDKIYYGKELPANVKTLLANAGLTPSDLTTIFNDQSRKAFETNSNLGKKPSLLKKMLTNMDGPKLSSKNLDKGGREVNGKTEMNQAKDSNGKPMVNANGEPLFESTNKNGTYNGQGSIVIDDDLAKTLEFELGGDVTEFQDKQRTCGGAEKALMSFFSTTFHEGVHFGRIASKLSNGIAYIENKLKQDWGNKFEKEAYGEQKARVNKSEIPDKEKTNTKNK